MAAGALGAGVFSLVGTAIQVAAQKRENKRQRDWMERMSNTSYQRGMADMRLAGLNPILAYQRGGANVPGAGGASVMPDVSLSRDVVNALQTRAAINKMKQDEATSAAQERTIEQKRRYDLPGQKYQAVKDEVKYNTAVEVRQGGIGKALSIRPDFDNFMGKKNPGGSYMQRYQRSRSRASAARRNIKSTRREQK